MSGVLVLTDGLKIVAELGMLDEIGNGYGQKREGESRVIEWNFAEKIGDNSRADLQGGYFGGKYPFGAVGDILQIQGGKPHYFGHRDGARTKIGAAQAETYGADN